MARAKMKTDNRSWKNLPIRKDILAPLITANLILMAAIAIVLVAGLLSPLYYDMLRSEDLWVQHVSGSLFLILLQRISMAMFLILVAAAMHQLVLSNRFCGPLVNFGHTFERMARGDYSRKVHLRKRDFLKPEADQVNAIIDRLQADSDKLSIYLDQLEQTLMRLAPDDRTTETESFRQTIAACRAIIAARKFATLAPPGR
ncbi:hypothetical protein DSCO28_48440 [Desulfosarcina ovata subsp. sediminis]|uniref:HAMP domain-containing protein n=2 Tax=Desulfosarcina ovata TaxID=83564 RepID=A0A5K7ZVQ0_9BACT|nr:hypothetical protein DSCO28_48440 [Desulfosarcina ovata subsp. sediminis]